MKNLAIILGRKNSKRLKGKNLLKIGGKTLVERAIDNAIKSKKTLDLGCNNGEYSKEIYLQKAN